MNRGRQEEGRKIKAKKENKEIMIYPYFSTLL